MWRHRVHSGVLFVIMDGSIFPSGQQAPYPRLDDAHPSNGKHRQEARNPAAAVQMNAVLYVLRTGCQWRALPKDFPLRSTVYGYFWEWPHFRVLDRIHHALVRSEEHTSELQSLMRISYAVFCLKKKKEDRPNTTDI